jgi:hypothetical protein
MDGQDMNEQIDPATAILRQIANTVAHAVRSGTEDDRKRVRKTISDMLHDTPAISENTAALREFFESLLTILDGNPVSAEGMEEPFAGIYDRIIQAIATPVGATPGNMDDELKQFLTQLAAGALMVCREGTEDEKSQMSARLREIEKNVVPAAAEVKPFVLALARLVDGNPVDKATLKEPYSGLYGKLLSEIKNVT